MAARRSPDDPNGGAAGRTTGSASLSSRFRKLWSGLHGHNALAIYSVLARFYGQEHRHYHTLAHVEDCLREFDVLRTTHPSFLPPRKWDAVELALWFHDIIHDPDAGDNEDRSADLFEAVASATVFPPRFIILVRSLILATERHAPAATPEGRVMLDCDLASLGYAPQLFSGSSAAIRREYGFLPDADFVRMRRGALLRLSQGPGIFQTEFMRDRYERQAHANIADALQKL